jgi:hypothetical protein
MTEPDERKAGRGLAIAEQQRRDAAFKEDRQRFKSRPDRSYRARLATQQEIKDLHSRGAWPPGWVPDRELLRLAIVKIDSERTGIEVQQDGAVSNAK